MPNGRCRLHGGLSTGPRTPEGRERIRQARTMTGFYSASAIAARREAAANYRHLRPRSASSAVLLDRLAGWFAQDRHKTIKRDGLRRILRLRP